MTDELKPVRCGCGGEAKVIMLIPEVYAVECSKCYIRTGGPACTETEAVEAWNKAMGAKDINVPNKERAAKVENQCAIYETLNPYKEGMCGNCGRNVYDHAKYCDECGARLEWE